MEDKKSPRIITNHLINGEFVPSSNSETFETFNPATEQVLANVQKGSIEDMQKAITSARIAFDQGPWRKYDNVQRSSRIYKFADLIEKNKEDLATLDTLNNGKPLKFTKALDLDIVIRSFRSMAGWVDKIAGKSVNVDGGGILAYTKKQPVGVCAFVLPWNFPLALLSWKLAPCLAAGCVAVIKSAEQTPLSTLRLVQLSQEAGFPPGVINVVSGFGDIGAYLVRHKSIDKISFTGSTQIGYDIMRNSHVSNLKRITLQLGGKASFIITSKALLQKSVPQSVMSAVFNSGQMCTAGSRTFVHESLYEPYLQKIKGMCQSLPVGDPLDQKTVMGPLASKEQFQRVMRYIQKGKEEGAKIISGGKRIGQKGYFIQPTIFVDVQDDMVIAKEEIFGPVMLIFKFKTNEEVLRRANSTRYGLANGVFTESFDQMQFFADNLKSGSVFINCYNCQSPQTPFGGMKDSGIGREMGEEGLNQYLETKAIFIKK